MPDLLLYFTTAACWLALSAMAWRAARPALATAPAVEDTRKDWGFYATPSLNGRLPEFGLRPVLIKSAASRFHVLLVERGQEAAFLDYVTKAALTIVTWLDNDANLAALEQLARRE